MMLKKMLEIRAHARKSNCKIKEWKLTEMEAFDLAEECKVVGTSSVTTFELIRSGKGQIFGSSIRVVE